jgi:hypothetical protein
MRAGSMIAPLISWFWMLFAAPAVAAVATQGPWIDYSSSGPSRIRDIHGDLTGEGGSHVRHATRTFRATLLAPIPARLVGGILIPRVEVSVAQTTVHGSEEVDAPWLQNRQVVPIGAIWIPHVAEGSPRWFLMGMRHGSLATKNTTAPMGEWIVGGDLEQTWPRLHHTDISRTRLLLRYRKFPHGDRWLPVAEHHIARANGTFVTLGLPTGVTGGWQTADLGFVWTSGIKTTSRAYPIGAPALGRTWSGPRVDLWAEGHTVTIFTGLRKRIDGILFGSAEFGAEQESRTLYTESGQKIGTTQTNFAPWFRIGLETWVDRT